MPDNPNQPNSQPYGNPDLIMQLAQRQMQQEMPQQMQAAHVRPMNEMDYDLLGGSGAYMNTYPNKTIAYNPILMSGLNQTDANSALAHELTHIKQIQGQPHPVLSALWQTAKDTLGLGGADIPYYQRPQEMEAFNAATSRALNRGETPMPVPSFNDGSWLNPHDIALPSRRKAK